MTTLGNQSQPGGNFIHWPPNGVYERGNLSFRTKAFYSCGKVKNTSWFRSIHSYNVKYGAVKASKSFPPPHPPNQGWENDAFWLLRGFILDSEGMGLCCSILFCLRW